MYNYSWDGLYIHYTSENEKLYSNQAFRSNDIFEQQKLVVRQILGNRIMTCFDKNNIYTDQTTYIINSTKNQNTLIPLLGLLNSKLLYFYFQNTFSDNKVNFPKIKRSQIIELPIVISNNTKFNDRIISIINSSDILNKKINSFQKRLTDNLTPMGHDPLNGTWKLSKKLQSFYDYDFKTFVKELKKKKVKLSLTEQDEWEDYFNAYTNEIKALQTEINRIDIEIDNMVYELYGLTEEEIKIVENS